ncbi:MAG TPA: DUF5655 domain-containing protein [Terriglobales bacterium]|nr:DUF5655 domain-containing protein [Terriglobales bacterium]
MPKQSSVKVESLYDVHPGIAMVQKWTRELKGKSGRSLPEWIELVRKEGPKDEQGRREWLKTKHGFGTNNAAWIAQRADGKGREEDDPETYLKAASGFVEQQYSGPKAALRPIYEALLKLGRSMGEVKVCPGKTIVPLYRKHVFAQIKPATNTRIDMGFALAKYKGKLPKRLIDTGGLAKKDRITHRIEVKAISDVDEEVKRWLKVAYELDA